MHTLTLRARLIAAGCAAAALWGIGAGAWAISQSLAPLIFFGYLGTIIVPGILFYLGLPPAKRSAGRRPLVAAIGIGMLAAALARVLAQHSIVAVEGFFFELFISTTRFYHTPDSSVPLPVLSSQFSVLSSWFSVLGSQFSVPGSQFSVLSSWFSVLGSHHTPPQLLVSYILMKALILSDVHSNVVALEAIWAREGDADAIYCAGDLVDYGVYPRETLAWMRAHNVVCVQGNHDRQVAETFYEPALWHVPESALQWRHHNAQRLTATDVDFLRLLPEAVTFELDGVRYGMTHLYRNYDLILSRHAYRSFCRTRFPNSAIDRLILGHTHRQGMMILGEREVWLNPGSVSYRRQDDPDREAHYIVIEDGVVSLRSVPYDYNAVYAEVMRQRVAADEMRAVQWCFGPRHE